MEITLRPIGIIHSPFTEKDKTPIQASRSQALGQVEIYPEFADGLKDIEALSHIYLLYVFHESQGYQLQVKPFLDNQEHGIFASRYPYRPNPIGISIVKVETFLCVAEKLNISEAAKQIHLSQPAVSHRPGDWLLSGARQGG